MELGRARAVKVLKARSVMVLHRVTGFPLAWLSVIACLLFIVLSTVRRPDFQNKTFHENVLEGPYQSVFINHYAAMPNQNYIEKALNDYEESVQRIAAENGKLHQNLQIAQIGRLKWRHLLSRAQKYSWVVEDDIAELGDGNGNYSQI